MDVSAGEKHGCRARRYKSVRRLGSDHACLIADLFKIVFMSLFCSLASRGPSTRVETMAVCPGRPSLWTVEEVYNRFMVSLSDYLMSRRGNKFLEQSGRMEWTESRPYGLSEQVRQIGLPSECWLSGQNAGHCMCAYLESKERIFSCVGVQLDPGSSKIPNPTFRTS
jgi:hypothetical protein